MHHFDLGGKIVRSLSVRSIELYSFKWGQNWDTSLFNSVTGQLQKVEIHLQIFHEFFESSKLTCFRCVGKKHAIIKHLLGGNVRFIIKWSVKTHGRLMRKRTMEFLLSIIPIWSYNSFQASPKNTHVKWKGVWPFASTFRITPWSQSNHPLPLILASWIVLLVFDVSSETLADVTANSECRNTFLATLASLFDYCFQDHCGRVMNSEMVM